MRITVGIGHKGATGAPLLGERSKSPCAVPAKWEELERGFRVRGELRASPSPEIPLPMLTRMEKLEMGNFDLSPRRGIPVAASIFQLLVFMFPLLAIAAPATKAPATLSNDKPVEISSDVLNVIQDAHQAIFSGNVIATQGTVHMRADKMIVHYNKTEEGAKKPKPAAQPDAPAAQGISRIDASGHVVFTNPTDTAKGDVAVYDVDKKTLDLTGTVILTRDKNILKGTHMHYDMQTGQSQLTAGNTAVSDTGVKVPGSGRVHGLFVPNAKPAVKP